MDARRPVRKPPSGVRWIEAIYEIWADLALDVMTLGQPSFAAATNLRFRAIYEN